MKPNVEAEAAAILFIAQDTHSHSPYGRDYFVISELAIDLHSSFPPNLHPIHPPQLSAAQVVLGLSHKLSTWRCES